jgi:hypothetical protein
MWQKIRTVVVAVIVSTAAVSAALAGVIFVPVGNIYLEPGNTPVRITNRDPDSLEIRSTGLRGEWIIDRADFPPEPIEPESGQIRLQVEQSLSLVLNLSLGIVEGRSRGRILAGDVGTYSFQFVADVRGTVSCLPLNGQACGQLILDLDLRGGLAEAGNPASAGQIRSQIVGSLVREGRSAIWQALDANVTIGANPALIDSLTGGSMTAVDG